MSPKEEICEFCHKVIGESEQAYAFKQKFIVCEKCYEELHHGNIDQKRISQTMPGLVGPLSHKEQVASSRGLHKITYLSPEAVKEGVERFEQEERRRLESNRADGPTCENCHKSFGIVPSLAFTAGGYKCEKCGLQFCTKCGYDAAVAVGRATMLCPNCSSDKTKPFRV